MEDPESTQRRFEAAVKVIRSLPEDGSYDLSDDMLVMFYSYYKQATAGPCNTLKPNSWDPIGKDKWEAWKALGNMSKEKAMEEYVQEIQQIIETIPVTDRMEELMDALDPFYEIVDDHDNYDDEDVALSGTNNEKGNDKEAEKVELGESARNGTNIEEDVEMVENWNRTDSNTLAGERGSVPVLNRNEESSMFSSVDDTHSSLDTQEDEDELVYDGSDDEKPSDSMEQPATKKKGSGVPRVHLANTDQAGANMQQGENRKPQCGSQDGEPQEVTPPVQTERNSPGSGRGRQVMGTNLPDKHEKLAECSCQGDGQCWLAEDQMKKQVFSTQIAVILSQLQDDMQDVLHRLTELELLTASQAEFSPIKTLNSESPKKRWLRWHLNTYPIAVALMVIWPFAASWLMGFYLRKRRRLRVK